MTEQRNNAEVEKLNIGSKVKIKTKFGEEFIGKTFVYDPMTKLVVLQEQSTVSGKRNLRIINSNFIESVTHLNDNNTNNNMTKTEKDKNLQNEDVKSDSQPLSKVVSLDDEELVQVVPINWSKIRQRDAEAHKRGEESILKIGRGVSVEAQLVFNEIDRAGLPVVWEGTSIIVLNNIRINSPYTSESCIALDSTGERSLTLVKKIVEKAQKKIEKTVKK